MRTRTKLQIFLSRVWDGLFGCAHFNLGRPFTHRNGITTVACLDCAKRYAYDLTNMRVKWERPVTDEELRGSTKQTTRSPHMLSGTEPTAHVHSHTHSCWKKEVRHGHIRNTAPCDAN